MPAISAKIIVEATVVAPRDLLAITTATSLLETFTTSFAFAKVSKSSSVKPIFIFPSIIAIVAGIAPSFLMIDSTFFAILTLSG